MDNHQKQPSQFPLSYCTSKPVMYIRLKNKIKQADLQVNKTGSNSNSSLSRNNIYMATNHKHRETNPGKIMFKNIGGLEEHIRIVKEAVMFPLLYHNVYDGCFMTAPRGILLYGPPGTGKTMIAAALANECSKMDKKVTFFSRKGADCLNKYVGESEKQLRSLFEKAKEMKPSIIFFDEIDGLAPKRTTSSHHDLVHASVVNTLLALMDGLDRMTGVIVIGATNRIDAIDSALRRPGRFDKELHFPLPIYKSRLEIIRLITSNWYHRPPKEYLESLAADCIGYCGADLNALCSEAALNALKRTYPNIYNSKRKIKINQKTIQIRKEDFENALQNITPSSYRTFSCAARRLPDIIKPLLNNTLEKVISQIESLFHHNFLNPLGLSCNESIYTSLICPCILITGSHLQGHTQYLAPAILHHYEHLPVYQLDVTTLFGRSLSSTDERCTQIFNNCRQTSPCILYSPNITDWWDLVDEATKQIFLALWSKMDYKSSVLLLATTACNFQDMPITLQKNFAEPRGLVIGMTNPTAIERKNFFSPLFFVKAMLPPIKITLPIPVVDIDFSNSEQDMKKYLTVINRGVKNNTQLRSCGGHKLRDLNYKSFGKSIKKNRKAKSKRPTMMLSQSKHFNDYGESSEKSLEEKKVFSNNNNVQVKKYVSSSETEIALGNANSVSIDQNGLNDVLTFLVKMTENYSVQDLEAIYESLDACIYNYRDVYDRNPLIEELTSKMLKFKYSYFHSQNKVA